jgi:peptidoglycan/LPS O-acetylase OafA/YrhL
VVLVILHHWGFSWPDHALARFFARTGWFGVDLFFVLSGFLVSGLILREHATRGSFEPWRFLARRGFKIYPAFYVFIAVSVALAGWLGIAENGDVATRLLAELTFTQNYADGLWTHTWSLAIEEHFYLLLAFVGALAIRRGYLDGSLRRAGLFLAGACVLVLAVRFISGPLLGGNWASIYTPTHLRIDGLLIGVAISCVWHRHREHVVEVVRRRRVVLAVVASVLLAPVVLGRPSPLLHTFGFTSIGLGFGMILLLVLSHERDSSRPTALRPLAFIGRYSYTTYLWHPFVFVVTDRLLERSAFANAVYLRLAIDVTAAFVVGIVLAHLVEIPALAVRNRLLPTSSEPATVTTPSPTIPHFAPGLPRPIVEPG